MYVSLARVFSSPMPPRVRMGRYGSREDNFVLCNQLRATRFAPISSGNKAIVREGLASMHVINLRSTVSDRTRNAVAIVLGSSGSCACVHGNQERSSTGFRLPSLNIWEGIERRIAWPLAITRCIISWRRPSCDAFILGESILPTIRSSAQYFTCVLGAIEMSRRL